MPLLTVLLSLTALLRPLSAHNGAVAIAVPVEGIVVDGDLSDWEWIAGRTDTGSHSHEA